MRFGWRPRLIDTLRRHGIDVACYGKGSPNGPLRTRRWRVSMRRAASISESAASGIRTGCSARRARFQSTDEGPSYLAQHSPQLALGIRDRQGNSHFPGPGALRGPANEARCPEIRQAVRARSLRDHTYTVPWTRVLQRLGGYGAGRCRSIRTRPSRL